MRTIFPNNSKGLSLNGVYGDKNINDVLLMDPSAPGYPGCNTYGGVFALLTANPSMLNELQEAHKEFS